MFRYQRFSIFILSFLCLVLAVAAVHPFTTRADGNNLVANLVWVAGTVEVKRDQTSQWVPVDDESLVGVGDSIRTGATGSAQITFFANGTQTNVLPNSEFQINDFNGNDTQYQLSVTLVTGQTLTHVAKLLDSGSTYTINSTGLVLGVRGTIFAVRVEPNGRSATIVQEGLVKAHNNGQVSSTLTNADADVPAGYGVRAEEGKGLSDVVPAKSFAELDAALDGCPAKLNVLGDVMLNVRIGPNLGSARIGQVNKNQQIMVLGTTTNTGWYRIVFKGGVGWILANGSLTINPGCPLVVHYPDNWHNEDPTRYVGLDSDINLTMTPTAIATDVVTAVPTSAATLLATP